MSLTSQLAPGQPLHTWFAEKFPGTQRLAGSIAAAVRDVAPVRPAGRVDARHWAAVGGAFGARLALLTDAAPPYYALYGLVRAGLVSREWADRTAATFPSHRGLDPERAARGLEIRPTPTGWIDLAGPADGPSQTHHERVLSEFFARLVAYLDQHAPAGKLGTTGVETGLARVCWLLAGWESAYRSAELPVELAELHRLPGYTVDDLRALPDEAVVAELVELASRLRHHPRDPRDRPLELWNTWSRDHPGDRTVLQGGALGVSAPVLVHHWADADLLIGSHLLDVKTVVRADDPAKTSRWLWQLLAYAWLDTTDRYRIGVVGLYLARHGVHVSWGTTTFEQALLGSTRGVDQAHAEFVDLASRVIAAEGAQPPPPLASRRRLRDRIPWR
ncbi:hypothetical protein ACFXGA_27085 [Actinosynnema sp. NPDC059335]|uniref:hypothetical protein n=1 Tax=Actinosynnema sp. NPDC059335 TaxID=3346804 RepID=UPI00366BA289